VCCVRLLWYYRKRFGDGGVVVVESDRVKVAGADLEYESRSGGGGCLRGSNKCERKEVRAELFLGRERKTGGNHRSTRGKRSRKAAVYFSYD